LDQRKTESFVATEAAGFWNLGEARWKEKRSTGNQYGETLTDFDSRARKTPSRSKGSNRGLAENLNGRKKKG